MGQFSSRLISRLSANGQTVWPITRDQVKNNAQVQHTSDDAVLLEGDNGIIPAAVGFIEERGNICLITQTWRDTYDKGFPSSPVELRKSPLQSVDSVKYLDDDYAEQTVSSADYRVDTYSWPGRLTLKTSSSWPTTVGEIADAWFQYKAGFGDAPSSVPTLWKQPIIVLATYWYEHPEAFYDRETPDHFNKALDRMIDVAGRLVRYA